MNRSLTIFSVLVIALAIGCAKSSPEENAKSIIRNLTSITSDSAAKMKNAKDDKEAAVIINAFASEVRKLNAEAQEFDKKNPGFKWKKNPALEPELKKFAEEIKAYIEAMMAIFMKNPDSKDLKEASEKLQGAFKESSIADSELK